MRKGWVWLLCGLFLAWSGAAGAAETIKIGHSVSLTGGASMWGQSEKLALEMLVSQC